MPAANTNTYHEASTEHRLRSTLHPPSPTRSSTTDLNLFSSLLSLSGFNFTAAAANLTSGGSAAGGPSSNGSSSAAAPMFSVFVPNNGAMRAFLSREGLSEAQLLGSTQQLRSLAAYHATLQPLAFADLGENHWAFCNAALHRAGTLHRRLRSMLAHSSCPTSARPDAACCLGAPSADTPCPTL